MSEGIQPNRLDENSSFSVGDTRFYPLSSPSHGGTELAVWQVRVPVGVAGPAHIIDREEVFLCVSGELVITIDGRVARLVEGDVLAVPAGSRLSARAGDVDAVALVCTRAGLRATFDDGTVLDPPWAR
jgi:quercetin dioxygenase-like cupin family protein